MDNSLDWISDAGVTPGAGVATVANAEQTEAQGTRLPMQRTPARYRVALAPTTVAAGASVQVFFDPSDAELMTIIGCATPLLTIAQGTSGNKQVAIKGDHSRWTTRRGDDVIVTNSSASDVTVTVLTHDATVKMEFN